MFVIDVEALQQSLEFYQTANGSVLCYDTVPSEFLTKIINIKDAAERFVKAQSKERDASPTKKSRRDRNTSRETSDEEPLQTSQLGEILSIAEFFHSEIYVQCTCRSKQSKLDTTFCRCVKKLRGLSDPQEKNAQMANERGTEVVRALVQLRIAEQTRRGNRHGSSPEQLQWAMVRDHYRRCVRKGITDPETHVERRLETHPHHRRPSGTADRQVRGGTNRKWPPVLRWWKRSLRW